VTGDLINKYLKLLNWKSELYIYCVRFKQNFCIVNIFVFECNLSSELKNHIPGHMIIQSDQKVSVHLTNTVQSSGAQRLFDCPVLTFIFCLF